MAWNQPGNNGKDNDPWGNNNNKKPKQNPSDLLKKVRRLLGNNNQPSSQSFMNNPIYIALIGVVIALLIWIANGVHQIAPEDRGVVTRFGEVQTELAQPGFNWFPPFIDRVELVNVKDIERLSIRNQFFIKNGTPANFNFVIEYQVSNPVDYLFNYDNVESSAKQVITSKLRELLLTLNEADFNQSEINSTQDLLLKAIKNQLTGMNMGIELVSLKIDQIKVHKTIESLKESEAKLENQEIEQASQLVNKELEQAKTQAAQLVKEAENYKAKKQAEAEAEYLRFEQALAQYQKEPEITQSRLYMEMMEKILNKSRVIMVTGNINKNGAGIILPLDKMPVTELKQTDVNTSKSQ